MGEAAEDRSSEVPVLVVGAGPTGLTIANLLGTMNIEVLVVERNADTAQEPRAVSFDDESLRTLQGCGLEAEAYEIILSGTGTKYFGGDWRPLGYARGPAVPPLGHPVKNPFSQPALERMLVSGLDRFEEVSLRRSCTLDSLELDGEVGATAVLRGPTGETERVHARFVIGCDGGRSTVRARCGVEMLGRSIREPWLVVDTLEDTHDQRYAMHYCDPRRPFVIVPGREGRCRYEFKLLDGETPEKITRFDAVRELLAPFREIRPEQLERCTVYDFHALVAQRWRSGAALLAGDAAHMMPPFAGQGLNSGIRDAANLAWKIAAVVRGTAEPRLLDTYEAERRPHAEATVALSVRLGKVMMSRRVGLARFRDVLIRVGSATLPPVRRYIELGRFKPNAHFGVGGAIVAAGPLVGTMLGQPRVLCSDTTIRPLDAILGPGFSLIGVDLAADLETLASGPVWEAIDPTLVDLRLDDRQPRGETPEVKVIADLDGGLTTALAACRGRILLVRPDRFVMADLPGDLGGDSADAVAGALNLLTARNETVELR